MERILPLHVFQLFVHISKFVLGGSTVFRNSNVFTAASDISEMGFL